MPMLPSRRSVGSITRTSTDRSSRFRWPSGTTPGRTREASGEALTREEAAVDLVATVGKIAAEVLAIVDRAGADNRVAVSVVVEEVAAAAAVVARNGKETGFARTVPIRTLPGEMSAIAASRPNRKEPEVEVPGASEDGEALVAAAAAIGEAEEAVSAVAGEAVPVELCEEAIETEISARDPTKLGSRTVFYITNFTFKLSCSH